MLRLGVPGPTLRHSRRERQRAAIRPRSIAADNSRYQRLHPRAGARRCRRHATDARDIFMVSGYGGRSPERITRRNNHQPRSQDTRAPPYSGRPISKLRHNRIRRRQVSNRALEPVPKTVNEDMSTFGEPTTQVSGLASLRQCSGQMQWSGHLPPLATCRGRPFCPLQPVD